MTHMMFGIVVYSVLLSPAFVLALLCKARSQMWVSVTLTVIYLALCALAIWLQFALQGLGKASVEDEAAGNFFVITLPIIMLAGIWSIHLAKMYLARKYGWWGGMVEKARKCYGFPVIHKEENKTDSNRA